MKEPKRKGFGKGVPEEGTPSLAEFAKAEQELADLKAKQKEAEGYNGVPKFKEDPIGWLLSYKERRVQRPLKKKVYLRWMILGVFGAHRFYARQWFTAFLWLALCWSGFSMAMTIIDLFVVIPMKPDENGIIWM